jgi:hypothetical protein
LRCDGRDTPTDAPIIARIANTHQLIRSRVTAKSAGYEDPVLKSMGALLNMDRSFKTVDF